MGEEKDESGKLKEETLEAEAVFGFQIEGVNRRGQVLLFDIWEEEEEKAEG